MDRKTISRLIYNYLYINPPRTEALQNEFGLGKTTIIDFISFFREVFIYCSYNNTAQLLGGDGKTVEIDEAKFGKRKYHRGRIIEGQWVFGGIERESKEVFVVAVPDRTSATLIGIIKERIRPGTTIISDCWRAYDALKDVPEYTHKTVNHSQNFVDPDSGAHTQNIQRSWRNARTFIPKYGRVEHHYEGYIAEYLFRRKFSSSKSKYCEFLRAIGELHNPNNPIHNEVSDESDNGENIDDEA